MDHVVHHPRVEDVEIHCASLRDVLQKTKAFSKAINDSLTMVGEASFDLHINLMAIVK